MFTPQEVSEKAFPKASFGGYNMNSVDEFLDSLTEDYTALYKENATLKAKLKVLAEKMEEYRATEDAMRSTLLTAQRMAAQMVEEARTEKEQILAAARDEATAEVTRLAQETENAQKKLALAQSELVAYIQRCKQICVQQAEFLTQLPEMDLVNAAEEAAAAEAEEATAACEEPVTEDTVQLIGQDIVRDYAAQEETAEEEAPAAEELVAPVKAPAEEDPFPADFRLDLEGLKFGRNYEAE